MSQPCDISLPPLRAGEGWGGVRAQRAVRIQDRRHVLLPIRSHGDIRLHAKARADQLNPNTPNLSSDSQSTVTPAKAEASDFSLDVRLDQIKSR